MKTFLTNNDQKVIRGAQSEAETNTVSREPLNLCSLNTSHTLVPKTRPSQSRALTSAIDGPVTLLGRIHNAAKINGTYEAELTANAPGKPTVDVKIAASAGPRIRDKLNCVDYSEIHIAT